MDEKSTKSTYSYRSSCNTRPEKLRSDDSQTLAAQTTKITHSEQIVGSLMTRVTTLETTTPCGSSSLVSARPWNIFGQNNGYTAAGSLGSHGPGSSNDNRNSRRRLDIVSSPLDEQARRAVI